MNGGVVENGVAPWWHEGSWGDKGDSDTSAAVDNGRRCGTEGECDRYSRQLLPDDEMECMVDGMIRKSPSSSNEADARL